MCFRHVWSLHEREAPAHGLEGPRHFYPQLELASSLKASDGDAGMWESLKVSDGDAGRVGDAPPPPPCTGEARRRGRRRGRRAALATPTHRSGGAKCRVVTAMRVVAARSRATAFLNGFWPDSCVGSL
eukprot:3227893-Prymnesium_polylepis.1